MVYFRCCSETNEFDIAAVICAKVMLLCSMNEIFILNREIQDVEHDKKKKLSDILLQKEMCLLFGRSVQIPI
jgi:hypothetical protein